MVLSGKEDGWPYSFATIVLGKEMAFVLLVNVRVPGMVDFKLSVI